MLISRGPLIIVILALFLVQQPKFIEFHVPSVVFIHLLIIVYIGYQNIS